tara:strand:+ start:4782 stop:5960 length:1179 start_codon:yes stop_codon:yes gene_type:complete
MDEKTEIVKKMKKINYLPKQYSNDNKLKINHNYLKEQFSDYPKILNEMTKIFKDCQFTLGNYVDECEKIFAKRVGAKFAIGVGSGTDAIFLSLKALGIKNGDEVITTPFTYIATVGAIVATGAKPVFVDIKDDCNIDENKIQKKINKKTKAIVPVHWTGKICEMKKIQNIAKKNKIKIVQDACHAIDANYSNKTPVKFGDFACYSMHPLKNLNVWGDAGFVTTQNRQLAKKIFLIRNHGLVNRDFCKVFGYNSRLDSIQALVATYLMKKKLSNITKRRISNAKMYDNLLKNNPNIILNKRDKKIKEVFHLYQIKVKNRNELKNFLIKNNVDAKVHYPIPIHLQKSSKYLGYKKGDFPMAEDISRNILSLPVHEFITKKQIKYVTNLINKFYN